MELQDLVGRHQLQGVSYGTVPVYSSWCDREYECSCLKFRLDGVVYVCMENPDDGYRSYMDALSIADETLANEFSDNEVVATHTSLHADILTLIDTTTGKIVLRVGTDHEDNYYPSYVSEFYPENMRLNLPQ